MNHEESSPGNQPQAAESSKIEIALTTTTNFYVKIAPSLRIVTVDAKFAPKVEQNDIVYEVMGLSKQKVTLEINGSGYGSNPIFSKELAADEKTNGIHTFHWDGKATCQNGDLAHKYIHPLYSPYKVHLFHDAALTDEKTFKVLYHSIELHWGKHTPDGKLPPPAEKIKYAQARLNELGYDAGKVDGVLNATTKKAIHRFQRANYVVGTHTLLHVNETLDAHTFSAIQHATAREIWEHGKTPLTQDAKFYVYDNFMNDTNMNFITGTTPEFNAGLANREQYVDNKMTRAYLPLEVEIKIQNKAGNGVSAPHAVGPALVAWEVNDAPEDATVISAGNPLAKAYVQHAREIGATATIAGAARIDKNGDNALKAFKGIREANDADYIKAWFPATPDNHLEPFVFDKFDTEVRGANTFQRAVVKAWDYATPHPLRLGRAGIYFRMSIKGGDDAKVRAALSFKGLSNEATLEADHASVSANLFRETGRWTVWRRARVSAYCQQAPPTRPSGLPNWGSVRDRWRDAFIEVENNGAPMQNLNYAAVVTEAVYKAAILALPPAHRPPHVNLHTHLTYSPTCLYGGPPIPQAPGEPAFAYVQRAGGAMLAWSMNAVDQTTLNTANALLKVLYDEARKTSAEGFVIFDYRVHNPITGQDWNPALNGGTGGFQPTTNPAAVNYINPHRGYVRCAGGVTMDVDNPFNVNCYIAHECGHARFLYHHVTNQVGPGETPSQHDLNQLRCIMSYPCVPQ